MLLEKSLKGCLVYPIWIYSSVLHFVLFYETFYNYHLVKFVPFFNVNYTELPCIFSVVFSGAGIFRYIEIILQPPSCTYVLAGHSSFWCIIYMFLIACIKHAFSWTYIWAVSVEWVLLLVFTILCFFLRHIFDYDFSASLNTKLRLQFFCFFFCLHELHLS